MGIGDKLKAAASSGSGISSTSGGHYESEVNKGSLNMGAFTAKLNQRYDQGWRLSHVFEQSGNTVLVWERHS